jgi:hypothetical protein
MASPVRMVLYDAKSQPYGMIWIACTTAHITSCYQQRTLHWQHVLTFVVDYAGRPLSFRPCLPHSPTPASPKECRFRFPRNKFD